VCESDFQEQYVSRKSALEAALALAATAAAQAEVDEVRRSVLQCVAVCCRVLQSVAVCCNGAEARVAVCCILLQCVAGCYSVLH